MIKNYESPELELVWLKLDVLTASGDNDAPFTDYEEPPIEEDWGQYY